jgi:hypothetical protein
MIAKPTDGLLVCLAAARAGNLDLGIIERAFGHDASPHRWISAHGLKSISGPGRPILHLAKRTQNIIDISIDLAVTSRRIGILVTRCLAPATAERNLKLSRHFDRCFAQNLPNYRNRQPPRPATNRSRFLRLFSFQPYEISCAKAWLMLSTWSS